MRLGGLIEGRSRLQCTMEVVRGWTMTYFNTVGKLNECIEEENDLV